MARALYHLLPQERPTSALDEVEEGVDLVGSIDGKVDDGVGVEISERNAEGEGLLVGLRGGGDADNVVELALAQKLADEVHGMLGCGTGAETEHHAGLDVLDGLIGGDLLELVLGQNDWRQRGRR